MHYVRALVFYSMYKQYIYICMMSVSEVYIQYVYVHVLTLHLLKVWHVPVIVVSADLGARVKLSWL